MIGLFLAVVVILIIIIYVLKSIFEETDYQTWLNIALVTIILLTVILSIFMILNRTNNTSKQTNTPPAKQEQTAEPKQQKQQKPQKQQKSMEEMTDEELSVIISENYLTLKKDYESKNNGKDGSEYAANKIIEAYGLTKEEWDDFYKKAVQNGYLKQAEENLKNKSTDYLIKK